MTSVIDGVPIGRTETPDTPLQAAELLADAAAAGLAVAPVGSGTALGLGNPPERVDLALSTANLGGIITYEPTDLVLSVGAGARIGDVQAVLAEHGQTLPLDAPGGDTATIGGLIATALAGPRRLGSGTLRDLLIGMAVAHPSGTVTKSGGMVVKNVTGFDLPRLYHGSLGTLGVIVSANFKVLPLARAEASLIVPATSAADALATAARLRDSRLRPVALEVALIEGQWQTALRLEGRLETVATLIQEAAALASAPANVLHGPESASWWRTYLTHHAIAHGTIDVLVRCAVRPRDTTALVDRLLPLITDHDGALTHLAASVGLGSVLVRVQFGDADGAAALRETLTGLTVIADHVTLLAAPPPWKLGLDVWGTPPDTLDVMRSLKEQFDPGRVLNPGRFVGFL